MKIEGAEPRPASDGGPRTGERPRRILLVDDEEVVRQVATRMLERLGFHVLAAQSGEEALASYAAGPGEIDLVLIDVSMPRISGAECFRRLQEIDPAVRAVLSSGYGQDRAARSLLGLGLAGFIQKPYQLAELSNVVSGALRG